MAHTRKKMTRRQKWTAALVLLAMIWACIWFSFPAGTFGQL